MPKSFLKIWGGQLDGNKPVLYLAIVVSSSASHHLRIFDSRDAFCSADRTCCCWGQAKPMRTVQFSSIALTYWLTPGSYRKYNSIDIELYDIWSVYQRPPNPSKDKTRALNTIQSDGTRFYQRSAFRAVGGLHSIIVICPVQTTTCWYSKETWSTGSAHIEIRLKTHLICLLLSCWIISYLLLRF